MQHFLVLIILEIFKNNEMTTFIINILTVSYSENIEAYIDYEREFNLFSLDIYSLIMLNLKRPQRL